MVEKSTSEKSVSIACSEDQERIAFTQLGELFREGRYSPKIVSDYMNIAKHFCYWLNINNVSLAAVDEVVVHEFLDTHTGACSCKIAKGTYNCWHRALRHFLKALQMSHIALPAPRIVQPHEEILQEFGSYLINVHGMTTSGMTMYLRSTKIFLMHMFADNVATYSSITVGDIQDYVAQKASIYRPQSVKAFCTALRSFLRFLLTTERLEFSLAEAVPTVADWKLSTLPRYIDDKQLNTFLSSFNVNTPLGLRDRAMALLMATVGLRSNEVAHLILDDIDWRQGAITLTKTKSRCIDHVPLVVEAGKALASYLQMGRPTTDVRNIFVTHRAPIGRALDGSAIRNAIRRTFTRCLPELPHHGTHVLRHTLATRLLRNGASLKEIADALRHKNIETTTCYAKVDIKGLRRVAAPWPEVIS